MFFYQVAPLDMRSPILIYRSCYKLKKGFVVCISIRSKTHKGVILGEVKQPDFECKDILSVIGFFSIQQQEIVRFISSYYYASLGECYGLFGYFLFTCIFGYKSTLHANTRFNSFCAKNPRILLNKSQQEHIKKHLKPLNNAQQSALDFISNNNISLLFGDTGSGKTEIYFHLISEALNNGKTALFLMPEISLTPQILARLKNVFGECVGVWHSKLSLKEKTKTLDKIHSKDIRIIAGARSALFLPLDCLGIIIVDEEHDEAYKSMSNPRYNARDLSLWIGQKQHIKVVLGSATPSLNSYLRAKKQGFLYRLRGQFFDVAKRFIFDNTSTQLSQTLIDSIHNVLKHNKQIIVFLPTRAHFKALLCNECGYGFQCPFCSVNMSVHLDKNMLCCHYCNFTSAIPKQCPSCNNTELLTRRVGTAQIAKELSIVFDKANIGIFDRDHITTHNKLKQTLEDFNNKKIDILVGTQMLSKGHDYHNVALAVILGIDYVLNGGDFKSFERGICLIHQIAGRSGRKQEGSVFIQSLQTQWIKDFLQDYEDFLIYESTHRSRSYPPFKRLAMIHCLNKNQQKASEEMFRILSVLHSKPAINIIGYGQSAITKIANKWRYHILLNASKTSDIIRAIEGLDIDIDIDAIETL